MNYYKRHLGDYARKAGHLSMLEHGAYTLILDAYYDREQPLTTKEAMRVCRARTREEREAVESVLSEFFFCDTEGLWVQNRVEEELRSATEAAEKARENGRKGGRPRKPRRLRSETQRVISGNQSGFILEPDGNPGITGSKANPLIHESTNPVREEKSPPEEELPPRLRVTTGGKA